MESDDRAPRVKTVQQQLRGKRIVCSGLWLMALLACGLAGCDRSASAPDGGSMMDRGLLYLEDGDNEKAIAAFSESLRLRPDNADAHYNRGLAHVRLGNFEAARVDYTAALGLRPEFSEAYTNRAVTYARRGQLDLAIADCTEAIRLKPENALAFRNRGLSFHEQGKYDRAIADFNEALRLDASLAEAYFNRAHSYLKLRRRSEAAADFAEAYRLDKTLDVPAEYRALRVDREGSGSPAALQEPVLAQPMPQPIPAVAATVEQTALNTVADLYKLEGFTVEPATESEKCELICRQAEISVHVKIKTIAQASDPIRLTADEIEHRRSSSTRTDLVVLCPDAHHATSDQKPGLRIVTRIIDWDPRADELKPIEFEYLQRH